jgi:nucleotide-binding universal stress UspA family protein
MKKILCPTDFSEASRNAIAYASKLAKAINASVTLLHVQQSLKGAFALIGKEKELVSGAINDLLTELSDEVYRTFKVPCHAELNESPKVFSSAIAEKATSYDLIVMGTNGVEDLYEFFTGSTSYNAVRKTQVPILLVPAAAIYSEIKSVVYAYDYLRQRSIPLKQLRPWAELLECEVTILQVNEEAVSEEVNEEMRELQYILNQPDKNEDINLHFDSIRSAEISTSINSYMVRTQSDLLVLSTTHRSFIEALFHKSVTKVISGIADYPVLVLHE